MNKYIDLTHTYTDNMPVYPGDPCSRLYQSSYISQNGFSDHKIEGCMHVGTHMDAPLHMVENGLYISDFPVEKFHGRGVLIDARERDIIDVKLVKDLDIQVGDVVLVWTGWDKKFRTDEYYKSWPVMTVEFSRFLVEKKIALIGMDTPGPDMDEAFPSHKIFLPNKVLIVENMTGIEQLANQKNFHVHAYPAKYQADAAPVRIFAHIAGS